MVVVVVVAKVRPDRIERPTPIPTNAWALGNAPTSDVTRHTIAAFFFPSWSVWVAGVYNFFFNRNVVIKERERAGERGRYR